MTISIVLVSVRYVHFLHGNLCLCSSFKCCSLHVVSTKMLHGAVVISYNSSWCVVGGKNRSFLLMIDCWAGYSDTSDFSQCSVFGIVDILYIRQARMSVEVVNDWKLLSQVLLDQSACKSYKSVSPE